jgi:proteasome accessory factor C
MVENAALRAVRLLDLVPFILEHQGITVKELAREFGVTKEEILKDLNLLFLCGLPGYTPLELIDISFEDEVVEVRDPQNLSKPRNLTYSEALITRIALNALQEILPKDSVKHLEIKALVQIIESTFSNTLPQGSLHIEIDKEMLHRQLIEVAIRDQQDLKIKYVNKTKDEVSERRVTPENISSYQDEIWLLGHCHSAGAARTFKLSNILEAQITARTDEVLSSTQENTSTHQIEFKLDRHDSKIMTVPGLRKSDDDPGAYQINIFQEPWLLRTAISEPGLEITSPKGARAKVRQAALMAISQYESIPSRS